MVAHDVRARPLRPGVSIWNPQLAGMGTLGFFALRQGSIVLVTCRHVACADVPGAPDVLRQPGDGEVIADVVDSHVALDVAAASLRGNQHPRNDSLGIGPLKGVRPPARGLRVIKSGYETGVTEGVIRYVGSGMVRVKQRGGVTDYALTKSGDSGATWVCIETRRAVAIHKRGNTSGAEYSEAVPVGDAFAALNLTWP